jgi:hypothetical protein
VVVARAGIDPRDLTRRNPKQGIFYFFIQITNSFQLFTAMIQNHPWIRRRNSCRSRSLPNEKRRRD